MISRSPDFARVLNDHLGLGDDGHEPALALLHLHATGDLVVYRLLGVIGDVDILRAFLPRRRVAL